MEEEEIEEEVEEVGQEVDDVMEKEAVQEVKVELEEPDREELTEQVEGKPEKEKTTLLEEAKFIPESLPKTPPVRFIKMKFKSQDDIEDELERLAQEFKKENEK